MSQVTRFTNDKWELSYPSPHSLSTSQLYCEELTYRMYS